MRLHFHTPAIIMFVAVAILLSPMISLRSRAFALSIEDEEKLGQEFLIQIKKHFEILEDEDANRFINDLGHYLITPLETKPFPFRFYIIKDNTLNAFAAPGGHIFIFSGLIDVLDNVDELAAVICHEIGHVSARHLSQRVEQSKKINIATMAGLLAGVLLGGGPAGEALMAGSMAAGVQAQLHYSRNDERQADQLGFTYMASDGFDPRGMIGTLEKIEKGQWLGTGKVPAYLLTHPTGPERMSNLDSMLNSYVPGHEKKEAAQFRKQFPVFKTICRATCLDPQEAERLFDLDLSKDPNASLAHLGLGMVYKERSDYDPAVKQFQKALEGGVGLLPILKNLAEVYQMKGQDNEAISYLEKALKLDDRDRGTRFLLAVSYENLQEYDKALRLFEELAAYEPVKSEVFYHLGLCYGRLDRLALAHYNFGLHFQRSGQKEKSLFHFRKAEELSAGDAALRRKIQDAMKKSL
jgi:predicted Zn-dependent protease